MEGINEAEVREALTRLDLLWDELFPAEQARIVQLLVERVDVSPDGADIRLRTEGLTNLVADLRAVRRAPQPRSRAPRRSRHGHRDPRAHHWESARTVWGRRLLHKAAPRTRSERRQGMPACVDFATDPCTSN